MILISPVTDRRLDPPQNVAWSRHTADINLGLVSGQMEIPRYLYSLQHNTMWFLTFDIYKYLHQLLAFLYLQVYVDTILTTMLI